MFNDQQTKVLQYELDPSRIKSRTKGNVNLSYLEGFDIIDTANKIFGFGNWNYSITSLEQVSQEVNTNQNNVICYKAVINVVVHDLQHSKHVSREDVGFGTGIAKMLADAHEGAAKEAVTDAIKRTMRSFGSQYGNSLYNKSRQPTQQFQQPNQQLPQNNHANTSQNNQQQYQQNKNEQEHDIQQLNAVGLSLEYQGNEIIVIGSSYGQQTLLKQLKYRFDPNRKCWWKENSHQQAA